MNSIKYKLKRSLSHILRPLRPGNILVIHLGRCGSTVLGQLLNQHKKILWGSELYETIFGQWRDENEGIETVGNMPVDAIEMLKDNYWHALHRYYGFEMKPYHFKLIQYSPSQFIELIESMGFTHFIVLDRKNRLRKIVSSVIAHEHKSYHTNRTRDKATSVSLNIDEIKIDFSCKSLVKFLDDYDEQFKQIQSLLKEKRVLNLNYEEDISQNPLIAYEKVCKFLNLKVQRVSIQLKKTNPFQIQSLIDNYEEVSSELKGTKHEWMLTSD